MDHIAGIVAKGVSRVRQGSCDIRGRQQRAPGLHGRSRTAVEDEVDIVRQRPGCHGAAGEGGVGKAIAGSAVALGDINTHLDVSIKGVAGTAMQAFGGQLSDTEMAAVITYQRNAFGNNTGDVVQPADVASYKKG